MACLQTIRLGDYGTILRGTIYDELDEPQDISDAVTKYLILKKPDGSSVQKTASFFTDGTDGKLIYAVQSGDIDQVGRWQLAAQVTTTTKFHNSTIDDFLVKKTI